MGKKNPYVFTIGFDSKNPNHVKVAKILNNMGRGKAQFIVDSILEHMEDSGLSAKAGIDMATIERIIRESVTREVDNAVNGGSSNLTENERMIVDLSKPQKVELTQTALENVKSSLNAFRSKK